MRCGHLRHVLQSLYAPCTRSREFRGGLDLPAALRALADAGLPPEALAVAIAALLRAAGGGQAPAMGPRREAVAG